MRRALSIIALAVVAPGCAFFQQQAQCYAPSLGARRCFADEQGLSADVRRQQLAAERAVEERAMVRAQAAVAERDAKESAERAKATVDYSDRVQDDAFDILVEMREDARERATASPSLSAAPSPAPQTPPAR